MVVLTSRADEPFRAVLTSRQCAEIRAHVPQVAADGKRRPTELEVVVREPATSHRINIQPIRRCCDGVAVSPDETIKNRRLKGLLGAA